MMDDGASFLLAGEVVCAGNAYLPVSRSSRAALEPIVTMLPYIPPNATLGCAIAAVATTGAIFGGLLGVFGDRAEAQPWLAANPAAHQLAAACDAQADRRARADCLTRVATTLRARDERGTQLARR